MANKINSETKNKVIIGQFLFVDNTPSASRNAVISDIEIPHFLEKISSDIKDKTSGYALWTYRDYRGNLLYNSNFSLGCDGWFCKKIKTIKNKSNNIIKLEKDSSIEQLIPPERNHFGYSGGITRLDINLSGSGDLLIFVGENKRIIYVRNDKSIQLSFPPIDGSVSFSIKGLSGEVFLKDINLYNFEQKSGVKLHDDRGSVFLNSFREMNSQM